MRNTNNRTNSAEKINYQSYFQLESSSWNNFTAPVPEEGGNEPLTDSSAKYCLCSQLHTEKPTKLQQTYTCYTLKRKHRWIQKSKNTERQKKKSFVKTLVTLIQNGTDHLPQK